MGFVSILSVGISQIFLDFGQFSIFKRKVLMRLGNSLGSNLFSLGVDENGVFIFGSQNQVIVSVDVLRHTNSDQLFSVVSEHLLDVSGNVTLKSSHSSVLHGASGTSGHKFGVSYQQSLWRRLCESCR